MHLAVLTLGTALAVFGPQAETGSAGPPPSGAVSVTGCLVTLKHDVDVAAEEAGILMDVLVTEGQEVKKGDLLAQIKDTQVQALKEVAKYKLEAAEEEAKNDVNVRHAEATALVREQDLAMALDANAEAPGSVSSSEIRKLGLALNEARLAIEQAQHDLNIAAKTVSVREAELRAAEDDVQRRKIHSPLDGLVVKRYVQPGVWVKPGDPVVRVISLDTLYVEGSVDASQYAPEDVENRMVTGTVTLPSGRQGAFRGKIIFADPEIQAGPQFLVRAEVDNRDRVLRPGQTPTMTIHLDRPAPPAGPRPSARPPATR